MRASKAHEERVLDLLTEVYELSRAGWYLIPSFNIQKKHGTWHNTLMVGEELGLYKRRKNGHAYEYHWTPDVRPNIHTARGVVKELTKRGKKAREANKEKAMTIQEPSLFKPEPKEEKLITVEIAGTSATMTFEQYTKLITNLNK